MADWTVILSWLVVAALVPVLFLAEHRVARTEGKDWKFHAIYFGVVVLLLLVVPHDVKYGLYSPIGVTVIGSVFPIYESIRAVCTPQGHDDKSWLQYWIAYSLLTFTTEWVDDIDFQDERYRQYWYDFEFFTLLWLLLPWTDGAALMFEYVTKPITKKWINKAEKKMTSVLNNIINTLVSATHLWILWAVFLFFPAGLKRFVTICIGVIYPWIASVVAVNTEDTFADDTFWLTYWSCYGCLYLIMNFLETYIGRIPGFYTLFIFASVYLMVPIMNGADKVFRNILVPLAGLKDMLMVRDALFMKHEMLSALTPAQRKAVKAVIAESFARNEDDDDEENDPLMRYGIGTSGGTAPTERTSLV